MMLLLPTVGHQARDTVSRSGYLPYNPDCIRVASTCGFRGPGESKGKAIRGLEYLSASRTCIAKESFSMVFTSPSGSSSGPARFQSSESVNIAMAKRCLWVAG
jgi:hypothetical protein